ncbi:MAG: ferritin family protein [Litorilinea sp.]
MSMQTLNWITGAGSARRASAHVAPTATAAQTAAIKSVRRLRQEYIQERLEMARNANQAHHLYLELAARARHEDDKARFLRLAESEERHLFRHIMRLKKVGYTPPTFRRSWFTKVWQRLVVACAPGRTQNRLKTMRRAETRRQIASIRRQAEMRQPKPGPHHAS